MKVLVADDEATTRMIAENALGRLGHECHAVTNGIDAWDAYRSLQPDVVISDWMMPGLTGPELCRNIRAQLASEYAYFIMISVYADPEHIIEGMSAGADDYLVKPLDPDALQPRLVAAARITKLHTELAKQRTDLEQLNLELTSVARKDPLTGLSNRLSLQEDLELLDARVSRYGLSYGLALFDVDHFKSYNDTHGHQAGDDILRAVASQLAYGARGGDSLYRYGGEEFLCILPEQSVDTASRVIERMRAGVQELAIPHVGNPRGVLTVSAGLATVEQQRFRPASEVVKEADGALYRAKRLGRNRVEHHMAVETEAQALASWLRRVADAQPDDVEAISLGHDGRGGQLLLDAAQLADGLAPDDERLVRLKGTGRFSVFYGERLFLGGGSVVRNAWSQSVHRAGASGETVLDEVIAAALRESVPTAMADAPSHGPGAL
jgi:two-component system, cell cycle response regulator